MGCSRGSRCVLRSFCGRFSVGFECYCYSFDWCQGSGFIVVRVRDELHCNS